MTMTVRLGKGTRHGGNRIRDEIVKGFFHRINRILSRKNQIYAFLCNGNRQVTEVSFLVSKARHPAIEQPANMHLISKVAR